jgi:hypothetical protein
MLNFLEKTFKKNDASEKYPANGVKNKEGMILLLPLCKTWHGFNCAQIWTGEKRESFIDSLLMIVTCFFLNGDMIQ